MVRQVQPLRISKSNSSASSNGGNNTINTATAAADSPNNKMASPRPLAEIGAGSQRRNSPSYNQATRRMIVSKEPSPFNSPEKSSASPGPEKTSPRMFWTGRENTLSPFRFDENTPDRSPSPASSPHRRPSVERLMQAGRVKSSNIFALETKDIYDPASTPIVERPSAHRPLSQQLLNNSFTRYDSLRKENNPMRSPSRPGAHKRSESDMAVPTFSPSKIALPDSPEKRPASSPSPTKSSMARTSMFASTPPYSSFDPENGTWSDDDQTGAATPRALHRHNKSVTFHEDPPTINEYEEQTPEPSVSAASREGSWDSDDFYDQDVSFERGSSAELPEHSWQHDDDDSFDADLENANKTPVVLPEHWSRMSPDDARNDLANHDDDVFGGESSRRPILGRSESVMSDGATRPLPAIPNNSDFAARAERASLLAGQLPAPARRQSEIERLQSETPEAETHNDGPTPLAEVPPSQPQAEEEDESYIADLADLDYAPPTISRESILKKVRGSKYDFEDEDDQDEPAAEGQSPARPSYEDLAKMHPDQPIPSRENSRENSESYKRGHVDTEEDQEVQIKQEPLDEDEPSMDMSTIPEAPHGSLFPGADEEARESSVLRHEPATPRQHPRVASQTAEEDDTSSFYSSVEPPDAESTVLHDEAPNEEQPADDGKETLDDAMQLLTVKDYSEVISSPHASTQPEDKSRDTSGGSFQGLPAYLSTGDFDFGMSKYITPSPPADDQENKNPLEAQNVPALDPPAELKEAVESTRPTSKDSSKDTAQAPAPELTDTPAIPAPQEGVDDMSPPGTPDSVVQNSRTSDISSLHPSELNGFDDEEDIYPEAELPEIPDPPAEDVPERRSTIKTHGKLRARPSVTPGDAEMMAQQRRTVSLEHPIPPIPAQYAVQDEDGLEAVQESDRPESALSETTASEGSEGSSGKVDSAVDASRPRSGDAEARRESRRQSRKMMKLDIPHLQTSEADDLGWGMEQEFERVMEGQKVGNPFLNAPKLMKPGEGKAHGGAAYYGQSAEADSYTAAYSPHHGYGGEHGDSSAGANHSPIRTQKGYLMRQNTKVVVASNRNVSGTSHATASSNDSAARPMSPTSSESRPPVSRRSSNRSPRKASGEQFLKTEPWNGKQRRRSQRAASAQKARNPYLNEPAPPLPGQESALGVVAEDYATTGPAEELDENAERGRLFVKVVGVKDLALPMPRNDRVYFQLTLDNGMHCVTTTSLELGKNAPIGQEFELVVQSDLEFQLTLTTKLPPPPRVETPTFSMRSRADSTTAKSGKSSPTKSAFSRLLSSPKKRAEKERAEREAQEAEERRLQEEAQRKRAARQPTAWDMLHELVNGADGSFARAYVNLKAHEHGCFGRQMTVDVPCYNEWALEKDSHVVNSVRSKRGTHAGPIRKPPYVVGKLELQLLYVPKPKGAADEQMPKSMSSAVREMGKAREVKEIVHEGCLSQQGGDCAHWRRRFFRLQNSKLTAYHEHTQQKRAVINLAKASRLVDDKTTLVADPTSANPNKSRRRSAFAEEDEGYQYVEEGFRIRFANGETIDFYADSRALKDQWMEVLSQVIGKSLDDGNKKARWTDVVLAKERKEAAFASTTTASGGAMAGGTESKDFEAPSTIASSTSSSAQAQQQRPSTAHASLDSHNTDEAVPTNADLDRRPSAIARKPLTAAAFSPPPVNSAGPPRSRTPPMSARSGGRSRDAVKSMIF
ncbi:DUF1709-domain-containing protein [Hortaea werneckii]|nr:DUF1709-domain-containing protein [Hortaea werneckii]